MSTLNVSNITDGTTTVGTEYVVNGSAKAWVIFDSSGTVTIRDGLNVSSITDSAAGHYIDNFTNSFANTDWVVQGSIGDQTGSLSFALFYDYVRTVSSQRMLHIKWDTGASYDPGVAEQLFVGDLA